MAKTKIEEQAGIDGKITQMVDRFKEAEEAESKNRQKAVESIKFAFGEDFDQWDQTVVLARQALGKPVFTLNKIPAIARQVIEDIQENPPCIQIDAVGNDASDETAEILEGICKHIEGNGEGTLAYEDGHKYLVLGGFANWIIRTYYLPKSFNQDICIERVSPFAVYWDPAAQKKDKSDARYCFVVYNLSDDAYKSEFPNSDLASFGFSEGYGNRAPGWMSEKGARVVEYYFIEEEQVELYMLADGTTAYEDEIPADARLALDPKTGQPISRLDSRRKAYVAKSNGVEWLEQPRELPSDDIPVVYAEGDTMEIDGDVRTKGLVQDVRESQRFHNYAASGVAEALATNSRAQWLVAAGQTEEYEAEWKQQNVRNMAVLHYKTVPGTDKPQKVAMEAPIESMSLAKQQAEQDMRAISGVFDATRNQNGESESGKAILTRRRQAARGNNLYKVAIGRAVRRTAQILIKLIPKIYDVHRILTITGKDGQNVTVAVHSGRPETVPAILQQGIEGVYDLSKGQYEVKVDVGGSDETQRQEAIEMLISLCQAMPQLAPSLADQIVKLMQFSGKQAIIERLQAMLPPQLQNNAEVTPAQAAQLQAQLQQAVAKIQELTQVLNSKQIEAQSRIEVERMKLQAAGVKADSQLETERLKAQAGIAREAAGKVFDAVHDHAMAHADATHAHKQHTHEAVTGLVMNALTPQQPELGQQ